MSRQECEAKREQLPVLTKTAMYSTHRQPPGCINTNAFRQGLGFLRLSSPSYCGGGENKKEDCFKCCKGSYFCKTRIIS